MSVLRVMLKRSVEPTNQLCQFRRTYAWYITDLLYQLSSIKHCHVNCLPTNVQTSSDLKLFPKSTDDGMQVTASLFTYIRTCFYLRFFLSVRLSFWKLNLSYSKVGGWEPFRINFFKGHTCSGMKVIWIRKIATFELCFAGELKETSVARTWPF